MTLTPDEKAALVRRYSERLSKFGPTIEALGWNKPKHRLRYEILLGYWSASAKSEPLRVLDFGCGFGDLFGHARERGIRLDYTGVDINPDLIAVARSRYPEARFFCSDLFEDASFDETFDVVLSSGVHNLKVSDNEGFLLQTFEAFNRLARWGFAVNFLSTRVNFRNEENHYSAPEAILSLGLRYSSRVLLRHDYMPFEFTLFVDKRDEIDHALTVYLPFVRECAGQVEETPPAGTSREQGGES